jgi:hypothetical protein
VEKILWIIAKDARISLLDADHPTVSLVKILKPNIYLVNIPMIRNAILRNTMRKFACVAQITTHNFFNFFCHIYPEKVKYNHMSYISMI